MEKFTIRLGNIQHMTNQFSDGLTFLLVLKGSVTLKSPSKNIELLENHIALINHGDLYTLRGSISNIVLIVNPNRSLLNQLVIGVTKERYSCDSSLSNEATEPLYDSLRRRIMRMALLYYRGDDGFLLLMSSELLQILYILKLHFKQAVLTAEKNVIPKRLGKIAEYMQEHYAQSLTLKSVSKEFYISPEYLSRLFKKEIGITFSGYLNTLRLENAKDDLRLSSLSVTRIALSHGFSSVGAFNNLFVNKFQCTPKEYRIKFHDKEDFDSNNFFLKTDSDDPLSTLLKFMDAYEEPPKDISMWKVQLNNANLSPLVLPEFCVDVGQLHFLMIKDLESQLIRAKEEIHIKYLSFDNLFSPSYITSIFSFYDALNLLTRLRDWGIVPWVRIDIERDDLDETLLHDICKYFGSEYLGKWRVEFIIKSQEHKEKLQNIYENLKNVVPNAYTGIKITSDMMADDMYGFDEGFLKKICKFVTTESNPNDAMTPMDAVSFEQFQRNFHLHTVAKLKIWMKQNNIDSPIWFSKWNTLTGRSAVEAGEFHRTALITHTILSLKSQVEGLTLQLNLKDHLQPEKLITQPLSLYLYKQIKRSLFFVARAIGKLGNEIILDKEGVLLTRQSKGCYVALLYHPRYMDPFESLENIRKERYNCNVQLTIAGLPRGKYQIKRLYMDKENGSTYRTWKKVDLTYVDNDVISYLEGANNPSVSMEIVHVEDEFLLKQSLSLNSTALCLIRLLENE